MLSVRIFSVRIFAALGACFAVSNYCALAFSATYFFYGFAADSSVAGRGVFEILRSDASAAAGDALRCGNRAWSLGAESWALAGVATLAFCAGDESLNAVALRNRSSFNDGWANFGRLYGNGITGFTVGGALYAGGLAFGSGELRAAGRMTLEALILAGAATTALKFLAGRSRPYRLQGAFRFEPFSFDNENFSFPSGHVTVAFAVSTVLARRIENPLLGAAFYVPAALTAFSRVYHEQHWISDVLWGALIGTFAGYGVTAADEEDFALPGGSSSSERLPRVRPYIGTMGVGVSVVW